MAKAKSIVEQVNDIKLDTPKASNPEEKVVLNVPISEQNTDDWVCIINGKTYQVQRGVDVLVPKYVKEVYDNSVRQQIESLKRSQALQKAALEKKDVLAFR